MNYIVQGGGFGRGKGLGVQVRFFSRRIYFLMVFRWFYKVFRFRGPPKMASNLDRFWEASWNRLWKHLGGVLAAFWRRLGAVLARLGRLLGRLGASWASLGASWRVLARLGRVLGASRGRLGASWGVLAASW